MMWILNAFFSSLVTTLSVGALGAGLALTFAFLLGASFRTLAIGGAIAAVFCVGIYGTGYLKGGANCRVAEELASAQANIAMLEHQRDALQSTIDRQNELDAGRAKEMADDDTRISQLEAIISAGNGDKSCPVAATARELRGIQAIGAANGRDKTSAVAGKHHWLFRSHADPN
jgi:hypothetical protein